MSVSKCRQALTPQTSIYDAHTPWVLLPVTMDSLSPNITFKKYFKKYNTRHTLLTVASQTHTFSYSQPSMLMDINTRIWFQKEQNNQEEEIK